MTPNLFDASVIDPDPRASVVLVELLKGIAENGLLANLHKDRWLRHVQDQRITTLPPSLKDRILTILNLLHGRHRLVRHPKRQAGDPTGDLEWLELALASHNRIPFHAILLSQDLRDRCGHNCGAFVEFFSALDSPQWEARRSRTRSLKKCEAEYRAALEPILRHARKLLLIDPYLNPNKPRFLKTVEICSELLGRRFQDRLPGSVEIHASAETQESEGANVDKDLDAWQAKLQPLVELHRHAFRVYLWERNPGGPPMHDRFILTDQCGISVPGGLDCRADREPASTDLTLMDEDARSRRWSDYHPATSPFRRVGYREVA